MDGRGPRVIRRRISSAVWVATRTVGWRWVFAAFGAFGLFVLVVSLGRRGRSTGRVGIASAPMPNATSRPTRHLLMLAAGLFGSAGTGFYFMFIVDSLISCGVAPAVAAGIAAAGSWVSIVSRVFIGVGSDCLRDQSQHLWLIVLLMSAATVGMIGLAFSSDPVVLAIATVLSIGIGMSWACLLNRTTLALFPNEASRATSDVQSSNFAGMVTGSVLFGAIAQNASFTVAWLPAILFVSVAILLFLLVGQGGQIAQSCQRGYHI